MTAAAVSVDRSTLRLSEVARHVVIPDGIERSLWLGWEGQLGVEERVHEFGIRFDRWQDGLAQVALGVTAERQFAATVGGVVLSIPRQVAKTFMTMVIVVALCTMFPNLTVLWTAHRGRLSTQTFNKMKALCRTKPVRRHLLPGREGIRSSHNEQEIHFRNGSVIMFGAREFGFGLGFDEVDIEVFDEAQRLTSAALEDMTPATNQSRWSFGALLFFMGTPPRPTDNGDEFTNRRKKALAVKDAAGVSNDFGGIAVGGRAVFIECSADPQCGRPDGPGLMDRAQIELANPSYPHRTPDVSIERLREQLTDDDAWRREALGIWDSDGFNAWQVIGRQQWADRSIDADASPRDGVLAFAVKFSTDGQRVSAAVALRPDEGPTHVESFGVRALSEGTASLVEWLAARWRKAGAILIDGKAGAGDLKAQLVAAGVSSRRVHVVTTDEAITAHSAFLRAVQEGELTHIAQPGLDAQVRLAGRRKIGNAGGWGWQAVTPDGDVTALDGVTLAHHGATTAKRRTGEGRSSGNRTASNGRRAVMA